MKEIIFYISDNGKAPVEEWLKSLDKPIRNRIIDRLTRVAENNYGDCKSVGDNVSELRFIFSKGYRIYFSEVNDVIILLLNAGDKSAQEKDIANAKKYLNIWRQNNGK